MSEKELDLIRQGKLAIRFGDDGQPLAAHEPILLDRMRFLSAVCRGYMVLNQRMKIHERCQGVRK